MHVKKVQPILKWAGGKTRLFNEISPLFPKTFQRYVEPFFGGGAIFFALQPRCSIIINDVNQELIELYEVVRTQPMDLMNALDGLSKKYSEEFYYEIRATVPTCRVMRAARTVFLNKTCFNGLYRQNSRGEFNVPFGKRLLCPKLYDAVNLLAVAETLSNVKLYNYDFEQVIDQTIVGDFIYCDPPYEPLSKTSSFNSYKSGGFSRSDQIRLKNACVRASQRGAHVVISNSSAEFIKNIYADYEINFIQAKRLINADAKRRGKIEELVIVIKEN